MIEYAYSRILTTIASVALVAVVVSASLGASEQASMRYVEQVADGICGAIESAREVDADSYEHRIEVDAGALGDLQITINRSHIEVANGGYLTTRSLSGDIRLIVNGAETECMNLAAGSVLLIKACREQLGKGNSVTVELVPAQPVILRTAETNLSASSLSLYM
jgi:hypothetical protein